MITLDPILESISKRASVKPIFFLVIYGATNNIYLCDSDRHSLISLEGSLYYFHGIVKDWGNVHTSINLFNKKSSISNCSLRIINIPYMKNSSNVWKRFSQTIFEENYIGRQAKIFMTIEEVNNFVLDEMVPIFTGIVKCPRDVTAEEFILDLEDASPLKHKIIPLDYVNRTDHPYAPVDNIGKRFPEVYGKFEMPVEGNGCLVEGVWISPTKLVFSGHISNSLSKVWILDPTLNKLVQLDSSQITIDTDDSGITTVALIETQAIFAHAYLHPNLIGVDQDDTYPTYPIFNPERCADLDLNTYTKFETPRNIVFPPPATQGGATLRGYFTENFPNAGTIISVAAECYYTTLNTSYINAATFKYYDPGGTPPYINALTNTGGSSWQSVDMTSYWIGAGISWDSIGSSDGGTTLDRLLTFASDYDIDESHHEIHRVVEWRIHIKYYPKLVAGWRVFAEMEGRKYGSWIDSVGRSNSYNEGSLIENPSFIIESILRDSLALGAANIDTDSFDSAATSLGSNWNLSVALQDPANSKDVIEEICRQCKMNFFFRADGRAAVKLIDISVTEDDTAGKDDIKKGSLTISKGDDDYLINQVNLDYKFWRPLKKFNWFLLTTNSTSVSSYGLCELQYKAGAISTLSVATNLSDHYCGSSGFWKDFREIIQLETIAMTKVAWEVGDLIKLDSTVNDILPMFNTNFGSAIFMIIDKYFAPEGIRFTMMKVN